MIGRILTGREFNLVLRLVLGGMFLYAAWDKVASPQSFAMSVRAYEIVPFSISNLFALCLAWAELAVGILLIVGLFIRSAAGASLMLMVMFFVAIATVLVRGMVVDCGCFGSEGGSAAGPLLLVRNAFLIVASVLVMRYNDGFLGVDRLMGRRA